MPRRPAPISLAEINRALMRAGQGKGTQLACLLKRCSRDDLAAAFSRYGADLGRALAHISGRQEMRDDVATWRRLARQRADRAEEQHQADVDFGAPAGSRQRIPTPEIPNGFVLVRDDVLASLAAGEPVSVSEDTDAA